jgi:hypothetical protein
VTEDNRIAEIREALSELDQWEHGSAHRVVERIQAILDSTPPPPRVFFPGDTVPADTGVMDETGGGGRRFGWDWVADYVYVECWIPTREEWRATVDQAHRARLAEATAQPHLDRASEERAIPEPTEGQNHG